MSRGAVVPASQARTWAEQAHFLVQVNPRQALDLAQRALIAASRERDVQAELAARYALGWAQYENGDAPSALSTLRAGIRLAERSGDRHGVGVLRRRLAHQLANGGDARAAQREIAAALVLLTGLERARSQVLRLDIHRLAHTASPAVQREVLADAAKALRELRSRQDVIWEARLLHNRAALHFDRVELGRAEADLIRSRSLYAARGADAAVAEVTAGLAEVALLRGEIVECLEILDEAEASLPVGAVSVGISGCRYLALMQARLLPEALEATEEFVRLFRRAGRAAFASAAELDLAVINLLVGRSVEAERAAAAAVRSFAALGRPVNAALARCVWLRARLATGAVAPSSFRAGLAAADVLESAGWRLDALRARVLLARAGLALGSIRRAERQLTLADGLRRRGTVSDRIELHETEALLRLARGDGRGAERALSRGIELLDEHRAALGALELRAAATDIGRGLFDLGVAIGVSSGQPAKVLRWAERQRGNALRLAPVRPAADPKLRRLQEELRYVSAEIRQSESNGMLARGSAARQAEIEAKIREVTRRVRGAGTAQIGVAGTGALARHALVEYVESDGRILAVTIVDGRSRLHELEPVEAVTGENEWLRFAIRGLADGRMSSAQRAAGRANAEASAATLDRALAEPLLSTLGDSPLVIVPSGSLHAIPWSMLPSLRGRPVTVSPSFSLWADIAHRPRSRRRRAAVIAGPRLRHATTEVRELAALLPGATALFGKEATAAAALEALDGAALAHLACHGHFRSDSPLFSSLELADGPLNVYELQQIRRAPEVVVLSACDLALSGVQAGNELLGLAVALLGMGTRTVIASVVPAPDAAARRMMLDFHRRVASGLTPAAALAEAQAKGPMAGFVCLGRG